MPLPRHELLVKQEQLYEKFFVWALSSGMIIIGLIGLVIFILLFPVPTIDFGFLVCWTLLLYATARGIWYFIRSLRQLALIQHQIQQESEPVVVVPAQRITTPLPPIIEAEFYELPG